MKIAVTVWENRISPVFDSAQTMLIAEIHKNQIFRRKTERFDPNRPHFLSERLKTMGVQLFLCGAISVFPAGTIEMAGIRLIPFITGDVEEILSALSAGKELVPAYLMPGCRCRYRTAIRKTKPGRACSAHDNKDKRCRRRPSKGPGKKQIEKRFSGL